MLIFEYSRLEKLRIRLASLVLGNNLYQKLIRDDGFIDRLKEQNRKSRY